MFLRIKHQSYGVKKMLNFLLDLDVSPEEIYDINHTASRTTVELMELSRNLVKETIAYFKSLGVTNVVDLIVKRPDLVLMNNLDLQEILIKIDNDLLIDLINYNIDELIEFGV